MKAIAYLLLALFLSSVFLGICHGALWFEGSNPQEPQELRLNMQSTDNTSVSLPTCYLYLNETQPKLVNLTIVVGTAALFYQTGNFDTWLSIDSQEPQKLDGLYHWEGSAAGELYARQYNVNLNGLEEGNHLVTVRIAGDYYGPDLPEGYVCQGNTTIVVSDQTKTSPTSITPTEPLQNTIFVALVLLLIAAGLGLLIFKLKKTKRKTDQMIPHFFRIVLPKQPRN
jgi:hypothetical protein